MLKYVLLNVFCSDIPSGRQYTVGRYNVCLHSFENTALPTLHIQVNILFVYILFKHSLTYSTFSGKFVCSQSSDNTPLPIQYFQGPKIQTA